MCMLSRFSHAWLFSVRWAAAHQAPLCSWGFSRQEYWSGLPCPPPGHLPDPGTEPASLTFPALAGRFFTTCATGDTSRSMGMCYRLRQTSYCGSWSNNYCWGFFTLEIFFFSFSWNIFIYTQVSERCVFGIEEIELWGLGLKGAGSLHVHIASNYLLVDQKYK